MTQERNGAGNQISECETRNLNESPIQGDEQNGKEGNGLGGADCDEPPGRTAWSAIPTYFAWEQGEKVEPWPVRVDGAALLNDLVSYLIRFLAGDRDRLFSRT